MWQAANAKRRRSDISAELTREPSSELIARNAAHSPPSGQLALIKEVLNLVTVASHVACQIDDEVNTCT